METINYKNNVETEHNEIKTKFEYLKAKIRLVEAAVKLNSMNAYSRASKEKGLIGINTKVSSLEENFDYYLKLEFENLKLEFNTLNGDLDDIIIAIEAVDSKKRVDPRYCRIGINYGREYIKKGLVEQFGSCVIFDLTKI